MNFLTHCSHYTPLVISNDHSHSYTPLVPEHRIVHVDFIPIEWWRRPFLRRWIDLWGVARYVCSKFFNAPLSFYCYHSPLFALSTVSNSIPIVPKTPHCSSENFPIANSRLLSQLPKHVDELFQRWGLISILYF